MRFWFGCVRLSIPLLTLSNPGASVVSVVRLLRAPDDAEKAWRMKGRPREGALVGQGRVSSAAAAYGKGPCERTGCCASRSLWRTRTSNMYAPTTMRPPSARGRGEDAGCGARHAAGDASARLLSEKNCQNRCRLAKITGRGPGEASPTGTAEEPKSPTFSNAWPLVSLRCAQHTAIFRRSHHAPPADNSVLLPFCISKSLRTIREKYTI